MNQRGSHFSTAKQPYEIFQLIEKIGQGTFANVYKAYDARFNRVVALKTINLSQMNDKTVRVSTITEINLFKSLSHDNIVKCHGYFSKGAQNHETVTLVLEYISGGDLENWIANKCKPLKTLIPEFQIWCIFEQISSAVAFIHKQRILHRDLKPANVLITPHLRVKLTDFGLSRIQNQASGAKTVCGTPYYMAPERISEKGYSYVSDVWGLGCILYELVALKSPFQSEKENITSLVEKIENSDYPPVPEDCYSDQLLHVLDSCMASDASQRPKSSEIHAVASRILKEHIEFM